MTLLKVPFTVALLAQFKQATAIHNASETSLSAAQLEAMWLDDGIEYIFAESEAMDYGGTNEEADTDPEFNNSDSSSFDLYPGTPFGLSQVAAEMFSFTQVTTEACLEAGTGKCVQWGPGDRSSPSDDDNKPDPKPKPDPEPEPKPSPDPDP